MKLCAHIMCFNETENPVYCSRACRAADYAKRAGDAYAQKARGSNPNRHIRIRVNGKQRPLHVVKIEEALGRSLTPFEIVHHVDRNKHHNCTWIDHCGCGGNLEVKPNREAHYLEHKSEINEGRRRQAAEKRAA